MPITPKQWTVPWKGGIDDVGIGVLFGLNTYRYDFIGLLMHAEHLEAKFGVGPHTISVPRICSADDINAGDFPNSISDEIFSKIVAVIRIAVPYTGMIISTRESQESRKKVLELGISQISGGSRTSVGGYAETELPDHNSAQFDVSDTRTLDEVVNWLLELGYIPSFCTACYREGTDRRPFHVISEIRSDSQLLRTECPDDSERVSGRLCFRRYPPERIRIDSKRNRPNP